MAFFLGWMIIKNSRSDGKSDHVNRASDAELAHDGKLVRFDSPNREVQSLSNVARPHSEGDML